MPLKSALFAGDKRIEAIEVSDAQHVKLGDRGDHVRKIQLALNGTDSSGLGPDGVFGTATQNAVLAFKTKRSIINRAYQTTPDAIVGKMTIVALDKELCALKEPTGHIRVRVLSPNRPDVPDRSHAFVNRSLPVTASIGDTGGPPHVSAGHILSVTAGQPALVEVRNAKGGWISGQGRANLQVRDPTSKQPVENISSDPQTVEIVGAQPHTAKIFFSVLRYVILKTETTALIVVVHNPDDPNIQPTMQPHNHQPTRKWRQLLSDIDQPTDDAVGKALYTLCGLGADPETFVSTAKTLYLNRFPAALKHLDWYLTEGRGADYIENDNITQWVNSDGKLRSLIRTFIKKNFAKQKHKDSIIVYNDDAYAENEEFRNTFGTVDKFFIAFDTTAQTVTVSFKDIYEWHPVCPPYYTQHKDDDVRNTNSLHAALVELKDKGACDFWMVGQATFPMSLFLP